MRATKTIILVALFLISGLADASQSLVCEYMHLLTQKTEPSLAAYSRVVGDMDPGEIELTIEMRHCRNQGWTKDSDACHRYNRSRWTNPDKAPSLFLRWVRSKFHTVNSHYKILSMRSSDRGFPHKLIEVKAGTDTFVLFKNTAPHTPTGLRIGIAQINGKPLDYWLPRVNPDAE